MICSSGDIIRLCWFLLFFIPFVQSQFGGNGLIDAKLDGLRGPGLPFPFNVDGSGSNRFPNSAGENRFGEPQGERAEPSVEDTQDEPVRQEAETTQAPSTLRAAIPEPETTGPPSTLRAAIPSPEPTSSFVLPASSLRAAIPSPKASTTSRINVLTSTGSATSTLTVSTTVLVTPSADSTADEAPLAAATESAADEDLLVTGDTSMSASTMAGVGVGITFGVLSIAGIAGFYIWRRYRNHQGHDNTTTAEQCNILGKFFGLKKYKDNKQDPEWSIESAEKVSIVKNMRAQSVGTVSRSNSQGSDEQRPGTRAGTGPVMNSTVVPPRRNVGMQNTALKSHPVTPDTSAFPVPPSFPGVAKMSDGAVKEREQKPSNWPLPD